MTLFCTDEPVYEPCQRCNKYGVDFISHNMHYVAVCPNCGFILAEGMTEEQCRAEYMKYYRKW